MQGLFLVYKTEIWRSKYQVSFKIIQLVKFLLTISHFFGFPLGPIPRLLHIGALFIRGLTSGALPPLDPPPLGPFLASSSQALAIRALPSRAHPSRAHPSRALPSGALSNGIYPSGALPIGALPIGAFRIGARPGKFILGPSP